MLFCYYQAVNAINAYWRRADLKSRHPKPRIFTNSHQTLLVSQKFGTLKVRSTSDQEQYDAAGDRLHILFTEICG
ncbi:hypothetical protein [Nostoc sp. ChiQUE01b]|uniref:hypothetical protein n=1 Tax=Nostoc sp. ChiQUE01b TaxID=3075376 RepID=UPI002AD2539E|nr:hypothetical protein [Nostoc sp. ChiQUE01b]